MRRVAIDFAWIGVAIAPSVIAQTAPAQSAFAVAQAESAAPVVLTDGEVRKVDRDTGTITLKHGPIPNMQMPPMTMVFKVKDPAMLDQVKAGDKVKFTAEKIGITSTITRIERVQ